MTLPTSVFSSIARSRQGAAIVAMLAASGAALAQDVTRPGDPIVASSTNFPAGENPGGVIDNSASSKYLNFDRIGTGFTVTPSGTGVVRALAIITANDAPERDPASYTLEGSDDGVAFTMISQGALNPPVTRYGLAQVVFPNSTAYAQYRVTFPTIRNNSANSMQVAEVQLLTARDVLTPGDAFTVTYADGAFSNADEGPANLFDERIDTKLGVFNAFNGPTVVTVTPGVGLTTVTGFDIFGGNDDIAFPGRTPSFVTLSGSNDGLTFTQIFTTPLTQADLDRQDQQFSFANSTAYRHYRIELGAPISDIFLQVGEFQLFGTFGDAPPANDDCSTALAVTAGATAGANFNARGTDTTPCGDADSADVWYSYTAAAAGVVEANTFGAGALDTTLAVYDGCSGPLLGCDDNSRGAKSRVRWTAVAGHAYKIRVAGTGAANGAFTLNIVANPTTHNDVFVPLTYNFNGMQQAGEGADADAPNGFRSLSDRAIRMTGTAGSLEVGLESSSSIPYSVVTQPNVLDTVQLGDRNTIDNGFSAFDTIVGHNDRDSDSNFLGVQPDWLSDSNQFTPQTTRTSALGLTMGPDTRIGLIYQASNGGTDFTMTLAFTGGMTAGVTLSAPDWFGDQNPPAASVGVELQRKLGVYFGTGNNDLPTPDVDLNVVEAVVSTASLNLGGLGDFNGMRLDSITFSDSTRVSADTGIFAVTVRDAVRGCRADLNGDGNLDPDDLADFITGYFATPSAPFTDWNGDGNIDPDDLSDYITVYFSGCP